MKKNTKNIEVKEFTIVPGTKIMMLVMKDGTRYFRQRSIRHANELYPGEARNSVGIISYNALWKNPDQQCRYARIWYDKSAYIHEDDVRSYILERQGAIENKIALRVRGRAPYWTVEAAAAIKILFGINVSTDGKHEQLTAPKEIADQFEKNPKLQSLYRANQAMLKGYLTMRKLPNYWAQLVKAEEDLFAWKLQQQD